MYDVELKTDSSMLKNEPLNDVTNKRFDTPS